MALAKGELVQVLAPEGIAILNYDDRNVRAMSEKTAARVLYYGLGEGAEVRGGEVQGDELRGLSFTLSFAEQEKRVQLHLPGTHGVMIALAAAAAGYAAEMPLDEVCAALETLAPGKGRCEIKPGPNGSTLIDDTYNANRQSIIAITRAMYATNIVPGGKRWAVLGDIFELGSYAHDEHFATGQALAQNVDYLVAIGDQARFYVEGAIHEGLPEESTYYFPAHPEKPEEVGAAKLAAVDLLKEHVHSEDLVLIKGSRGMQMETMIAALK